MAVPPSTPESTNKALVAVKDAIVIPLKDIAGQFKGVFGTAYKSNQGQSVFGKSLEVLATTVGTTLTPVFVTLAAGVLAASDWITEKLIPGIEGFAEWIFKAADAVAGFVEEMGDAASNAVDSFDRLLSGDFEGAAAKFSRPGTLGGYFAEELGLVQRVESFGGSDNKDGSNKPSRYQSALRDVLTEMRQAMGSNPQFQGLADAAKQAQLAALGSPFERRMLEMTDKMLRAMEKTANNTSKSDDDFNTGGDWGFDPRNAK